jgi:hypothetical protein
MHSLLTGGDYGMSGSDVPVIWAGVDPNYPQPAHYVSPEASNVHGEWLV